MNRLKLLLLKLKNYTWIDILILFFGLIGYYSGHYILVVYTLLHFFVLIAQSLSKGFRTKLENFKRDQKTIKEHYLQDFKFFYYGVLSSRMITFGFYIYFFSLEAENLEAFSTLFYFITYSFIIVGFMDLGITLYIIFFKNTPVTELVLNVCYHCVTKGGPMLLLITIIC